MNPFDYARVETCPSSRLPRAREPGARYIAGGTNILDLMKIAVETPPLLVDINALPLPCIDVTGRYLASARSRGLTDVAPIRTFARTCRWSRSRWKQSASPQLRNMATIGGNSAAAHPLPVLSRRRHALQQARPGQRLQRYRGENRREAVLGTSEHCIATHASDLAVALAALDATIHVIGRAGDREIALATSIACLAMTPHSKTRCARRAHRRRLASVAAFRARPTYVKVRDRAQYDFALASAAVALDLKAAPIARRASLWAASRLFPGGSPEAERALSERPQPARRSSTAAEIACAGARDAARTILRSCWQSARWCARLKSRGIVSQPLIGAPHDRVEGRTRSPARRRIPPDSRRGLAPRRRRSEHHRKADASLIDDEPRAAAPGVVEIMTHR